MNSYIQLICLIFSFVYGFVIYFTNRINYKILCNKGLVVSVVGSILYVNNMALFYLFFLYKINFGILHIYFLLFIVLGYIFGSVKNRK